MWKFKSPSDSNGTFGGSGKFSDRVGRLIVSDGLSGLARYAKPFRVSYLCVFFPREGISCLTNIVSII